MVHIAESTVGRRYAGWFVRNTEHAQRVLDGLRNAPLPSAPASAAPLPSSTAEQSKPAAGGKVVWGAVKVGA